MIKPRYPIYIPSKGRADRPLTIRLFQREAVPFRVVVEPQEVAAYSKVAGSANVLALPESGRGLTYSRNWIKQHSTEEGHERHWQFDDDIHGIMRLNRRKRIYCDAGAALAACEDFCDRYENIGVASLNYEKFVTPSEKWPPFSLNTRCYTLFLVSNKMPLWFRGKFNEDTDMTLQVLASGLCTVLFNVFLIQTVAAMASVGGQTEKYVNDDGRLKMARTLERVWPGVVTTRRRFQRPQHVVKDSWRKFDTPLKLKEGLNLKAFKPNEYGLKLKKKAEPKSSRIRKLYDEYQKKE